MFVSILETNKAHSFIFEIEDAAQAFAAQNADDYVTAEIQPYQGGRFRVILKDAETGEILG